MVQKSLYRPDIRVRLIGEQPFFGPGTAALLRGIERCGSVAAVCEAIQLSYSKGRAMLRLLARELGYPVVIRSRGGAGGGSARITPEGERLLEAFARYEEEVRRYAQQNFHQMLQALEQEARP